MGEALVSRLSAARAHALAALTQADASGRYVRDVFASMPGADRLDARDRGLALRLALGVTATSGCLDELLDRYLAKPHKVSSRVRFCLRIAAFELMYLGTPREVAVSQGVELVRSQARSASGLANAVLRRVADGAAAYLEARDLDEAERPVGSLARRGGLPRWLAAALVGSLGYEGASALACAQLEPAPLAIHLNPRMATGPSCTGREAPLLGAWADVDGQRLLAQGALERADAVVSDLNAQLVATSATRAGSCLEIGAGRGTKTFMMLSQAARAGFAHEHVALDLYERKCALNRERIARAALGEPAFVSGDACALDEALAPLDEGCSKRLFDTVFVDAPCSGTGTMRRHPEIPWRLTAEEATEGLPALQLSMLREAAGRVATAGELLYATCSVLGAENEGVVDAFLVSPEGERFALMPVSESDIFDVPAFMPAARAVERCQDGRGCFQSLPSVGSYDGHFCARFVRLA